MFKYAAALPMWFVPEIIYLFSSNSYSEAFLPDFPASPALIIACPAAFKSLRAKLTLFERPGISEKPYNYN